MQDSVSSLMEEASEGYWVVAAGCVAVEGLRVDGGGVLGLMGWFGCLGGG